MSITEKLMVLSGTLWLCALGFIVYAWILQHRQEILLRYIATRLKQIEKLITQNTAPDLGAPSPAPASSSRSKPETSISIDKNEPLSKYETVTLPDEININFVDR